MFVEKVPTGLQLEPVDLHSEAQEDHGLGSPPPNLCRAPVAPVEVLDGTEVSAGRTADHEERLLLPDLFSSSSPVVSPPEIPSHTVGVGSQVEGGSSSQRHPRKPTQLLGDSGRAVQLSHLGDGIPTADPMNQQHLVDAVGFTGSLRREDPAEAILGQRVQERLVIVGLHVHLHRQGVHHVLGDVGVLRETCLTSSTSVDLNDVSRDTSGRSIGVIKSWSICNTAASRLTICPRKIITQRLTPNTCSLRRLHPALDLLVLALMSLLQALIPSSGHRGLDAGPTHDSVPDAPGRLAVAHESAAPAVGRVPILLQVGVSDVHLLGTFTSTGSHGG